MTRNAIERHAIDTDATFIGKPVNDRLVDLSLAIEIVSKSLSSLSKWLAKSILKCGMHLPVIVAAVAFAIGIATAGVTFHDPKISW